MPSAATEVNRARILADYGILDTGAEKAFDDLTALASQLCGAPASIITFIDGDRLWFKSAHGLTATEAPVEHSFCAHAAGQPGEVFTIENALADGRFLENVFVMPADGLRAYAGANIVDPTGVPLGSICVVDFEERTFTDAQRDALDRLSRQVVDQLQLRRRVVELERRERALAIANDHFERVAYILTHDFRGPLLTQSQMVDAILEDFPDEIPEPAAEMIAALRRGAMGALGTLERVVGYLRESSTGEAPPTDVAVADLFAALRERVDDFGSTELSFDAGFVRTVRTHPVALEHILLNLVNNAVRYVGQPDGQVRVSARRERGEVVFSVTDNGPGIDPADRERVFELFARGSAAGGDGGTGVGLALSQRLAASLGGRVELGEAPAGGGCVFRVRVPG